MIELIIDEKSYGNNNIFHDAKINIEEKQMVAIKGMSGSGKSTLLSMIGLLEDFEGKYYFKNEIIDKHNKESIRRNYFSYVFQKPFLIPYMNVKENILMPLKNLKENIDSAKYNEILGILNISELENRYPDTLSGGEAQRVSIARAVLSNRKIILCDEPTGSLDPLNTKIVMDSLKKIQNTLNVSIIVVTHSSEFDSYFDAIFYIENKKVLQNVSA